MTAWDWRRDWIWPAAMLLALAVHLGGLTALRIDPPRTPDPGLDGIMVSLGNTGTAPMDAPAEASDDPEVPMADQGQEDAPPDLPSGDSVLREAAPATAPPVPAPVPTQAAEPAPAPDNPLSAARPETKPEPPQQVAETPPEPAPEPQPAPRPTDAPLAERTFTPQETSPPLAPLPEALVPDRPNDMQQARPAVPPEDPSTAAAPSQPSSRLGAIGGAPVWRHGPPPENAGHVPEGSDYWNRVYRALHDAGRYPPEAAPKGLEGIAVVEFVIDRDGKILTYRRLQSAGHILFDHEVNRMMKWAEIPPPPASLPDEALIVLLNVNFEIIRMNYSRRAAN